MKTQTAFAAPFSKLTDSSKSPTGFDLLFADIKIEWAQHFAPTFSVYSQPAHSCISIALNFFFHASFHYFGGDAVKAKQFMTANLFDILMFSETIRERIGIGEEGVISEWRLETVARMIQTWVKTKAETKQPKTDVISRPSLWRRFLNWLIGK